MSNDDQTVKLPDEASATPPTQPTMETVLRRINELGQQLRIEINQSADSLEQNLTRQIAGLRAEMVDQFARLTEKIVFRP